MHERALTDSSEMAVFVSTEHNFLDAFVNHLPAGTAHFGRRLLSYAPREDGQSIEMTFADSSNEWCDILIGCDGIKSMVRRQMFEKKADNGLPDLRRFVEPVWSGITAYRGLISASAFPVDSNGLSHSATQRPIMVRWLVSCATLFFMTFCS